MDVIPGVKPSFVSLATLWLVVLLGLVIVDAVVLPANTHSPFVTLGAVLLNVIAIGWLVQLTLESRSRFDAAGVTRLSLRGRERILWEDVQELELRWLTVILHTDTTRTTLHLALYKDPAAVWARLQDCIAVRGPANELD
jgi:hypothetical protein